jgi:hypothetical protein
VEKLSLLLLKVIHNWISRYVIETPETGSLSPLITTIHCSFCLIILLYAWLQRRSTS